tara:strand:- start:660 stop:1523 length:864 start_codon:yes stop_codon:yes gene_type:complete
MPEITAPGANPLKKYFRQPKLYVSLPSKALYYPEGTIDYPENGELPVLAMTAKDELAMRTPDALINGQSTVDIIQSCIPNIKNAWSMPSIDVDTILIAIRIATFGELMEINTVAPNTDIERGFQLDLRLLLQQFAQVQFESDIFINEMKISIRPLTYAEFTETALKTFEEQRMFNLLNDDKLEQQEKLKLFNNSFNKIRDMTIGMIVKSISSIEIDGEVVNNQIHIADFISNADKSFFDAVIKHIEKQKEKFAVAPIPVAADEEQVAAGAPAEYLVPVTFDQSNFFA